MPEGTTNSLINLGDIAKPADTLIKKIAKAVGGIFEPHQIVRIAKAEAEAAIIKTQTDIQVTDIQRRAMHRFIEEETQKQQNIEQITQKAIPLLNQESSPSDMEDDWVTNFFDKSRIISDGEMQGLWARVLAGEANEPGTYSKRTVNFLSDLDKKDAETFESLCRFGWFLGKFTPLVFDAKAAIYNDNGLNFNALTHLDSIGLIQFNSLAGFQRTGLPKNFTVLYCGQPVELTMPNENNNLTIGKVLLTKVGEELVSVCNAQGVDGFMDYVKEQWKDYLPQNT